MSKQIVVVDIDGTLSIVGERKKYAHQKPNPDWPAFHNDCDKDEPHKDMIKLVNVLSMCYELVFCSLRSELVRDKTVGWLAHNFDYPCWCLESCYTLLLRDPSDERPNWWATKPAMLHKFISTREANVAFILEDDLRMTEEWRRLGYRCLNVGKHESI